jgi:hypothetical protein
VPGRTSPDKEMKHTCLSVLLLGACGAMSAVQKQYLVLGTEHSVPGHSPQYVRVHSYTVRSTHHLT